VFNFFQDLPKNGYFPPNFIEYFFQVPFFLSEKEENTSIGRKKKKISLFRFSSTLNQ